MRSKSPPTQGAHDVQGEPAGVAAYGLAEQVGDRLLGTDRRQRVRVLHSLIAFGVMALGALAMGWLARTGLAPARPVAAWAAVSLGGYLCILALLRSGWSRRFADPSLTLVQIVYSVLSCSVAYALSGPARGGVLPLLTVAVMFGMFRLAPRTVWRVGLFAAVLLTAVSLTMAEVDPAHFPTAVEGVHLFVAAMVLPLVSLLGGQVSRLRERDRAHRLEIADAFERLRALAGRDELTGLYNRRQMNDLIGQEASRSKRAGSAFCLVMLDIDRFKRINDDHGHAAGDEVLRAFARVATAAIRQSDVLARWGGEEFALLLPGTSLGAGVEVANRLRTQVEAAMPKATARRLAVTVSAGVAERAPDEPIAAAFERADRALYRAKEEGRNRVAMG